jgi:hypothetical protein
VRDRMRAVQFEEPAHFRFSDSTTKEARRLFTPVPPP